MAVQNMVSAPARNNSFSKPSNGDGPTSGTSIQGFGGSKTPSQVLSAAAGKAPKTMGMSVKGFSDGSLINGKI